MTRLVRPHRAMVVALAAALLVAPTASAQVATLAGPEQTPEPEAATDADLEFADREEALLAFAQCMRDNGIEMDDPQLEGGRGRFLRQAGARAFDELDETFMAASQACAPILEAARPELDPEAEQERLELQLALAQCIRENGYPEYPDPAIGSDGRLQRIGRQSAELGIDPRSEEFIEVRSACAEQLDVEAFGPGPGGARGAGRGGDG